MKINQDFILEPAYALNPKGDSSQKFLQLMQESFPLTPMIARREQGRMLEIEARRIPWQDDLRQWPPAHPENFGRVAFFRMFPSSTQRGIGKQVATAEGIQAERVAWIKAHLMIQEWIANEEHPTFERITQLNNIFGHKVRTRVLHEKFRCFDVEDLPEAIQYFDSWYQNMNANRIWPIQKASLVAGYLIAVHPFDNGNGRTARLVLDWILGLHGLPPASFVSRYHALITRSPGTWDTPHPLALTRVMDAIGNTLKIIQGVDILEEEQPELQKPV